MQSLSQSSKVAQAQNILLRHGKQTRGDKGHFFHTEDSNRAERGGVPTCELIYPWAHVSLLQPLDPQRLVADPSQCVGVLGQGVLSSGMQRLLPPLGALYPSSAWRLEDCAISVSASALVSSAEGFTDVKLGAGHTCVKGSQS